MRCQPLGKGALTKPLLVTCRCAAKERAQEGTLFFSRIIRRSGWHCGHAGSLGDVQRETLLRSGELGLARVKTAALCARPVRNG